MRNLVKTILTLVLLFPASALAATFTNGIWENSYDCADWYQTSAGENYCGVSWESSYCAAFVNGTQLPCDQDSDSRSATISSAVNNPDGVVGSGAHIHYFGTGSGGSPLVNNKSSGANIEFAAQTEIWIRWYVYYETDSNNTGWKNYRLHDSSDNEVWSAIPYNQTDKYIQVYFLDASANKIKYSPDNDPPGNWMELNSRQGYGEWICHELYFNIGGGAAGSTNDTFRQWQNGELIINWENIDTGLNNVAQFAAANNGDGISSTSGQRLVGIYHDDYAIATSSYTGFVQDAAGNDMIGELSGGGADTTSPTVTATNIANQSSGTTSVTPSCTATDNVDVTACLWSSNAAHANDYSSMTGTMTESSGWSADSDYTGLSDGNTYTLYYGCTDAAGNYGYDNDSFEVLTTPRTTGISLMSVRFNE